MDIIHHPAPDAPDFLGMYSMAPLTDYEEQIRGINRIRNTVINATRRIICYSQTIYDDVRLETSEYAGLTLAIRDASVRTEVQPMYDFVAIEIIDDDGEFLISQSQTVIILHTHYRCCGGSGGDILPGLRGCGCGRGVCCGSQSKHHMSHRIFL